MLVTRDISFWFLLKLMGNIALTFIPLSLPIAVFFSTIYCLNRLSGDSEYIAMRAGGLTKFRILIPFLLVAGLLTLSVYQLNQNVIPKSNKTFRQKINHLASSGLLAGIKEGQFFTLIPGVTLFASKSTKYGKELHEVFLNLDDNKKSRKIIFAEKGELKIQSSSGAISEKITLTLYNGNIVDQSADGDVEKILFQKYVFPVTQKQLADQFSIKETMLTSDELKVVMNMSEKDAEKNYKFNKKDLFNARYEFWNRKNGALICFVFCFLGFTLGVTANRGRVKNSGFWGLMCLILYYSLYFSLVGVAKKGIIPIPIAVFTPVFIIGILGCYFYRKLDWQ
jgi:lipopolysaccharide export LptBFGC system permease protein LptF